MGALYCTEFLMSSVAAYAVALQPLAYAPRLGMQHSAFVGYTCTWPLRSALAYCTAVVLTRMSLAVAVRLPAGPAQPQTKDTSTDTATGYQHNNPGPCTQTALGLIA
jgi:hypothetical protein